MEHEKYSYAEALRWLAARYNVEIEEKEVSPEVKQQQQVAESLYIINGFAQHFFTDALFGSEEGQDIGLSYLKERGFTEDIMRKFQLGYSPDQRDVFARAALAAQYNLEYLQRSGLVVVRDDRPMDNYRGRIIFPVHNQTGKVMGFGARIIKSNDRAPKYINTPENEIYVKSKILYGSWLARQAIDRQDECLLVEGYTDVISLHQAGIENVVASGGTSLTVDQLRLVKKYTNHLTIIYDGDGAGIKAALRGLDMALEESLDVKLVLIPDKEDPDRYVRKLGAVSFREFVAANKKDFIIFQLEVALEGCGRVIQAKSQSWSTRWPKRSPRSIKPRISPGKRIISGNVRRFCGSRKRGCIRWSISLSAKGWPKLKAVPGLPGCKGEAGWPGAAERGMESAEPGMAAGMWVRMAAGWI